MTIERSTRGIKSSEILCVDQKDTAMASVSSIVNYTAPSTNKTYSIAVVYKTNPIERTGSDPIKTTQFWRLTERHEPGELIEGELTISLPPPGSYMLTGAKPQLSLWGEETGHVSWPDAQAVVNTLSSSRT